MRKTCPFCDSDLLGIGWGQNNLDGDFCSVKCKICSASGPKSDTEDDAWKLWNNREGGDKYE